MIGKIIIHIEATPEGNIAMSSNTTDLGLVNFILDKLKFQIISAKPKEPSPIQKV